MSSPGQEPPLSARLMRHLARFCSLRAVPILVVSLVLAALSVWITVDRLGFKTDRNDLIGTNAPYFVDYQAYKDEFPIEDDIVVIVQSPDRDRNRQVVDALGAMLRGEPEYFRDVYARVDLGFVRRRLLLFMSVPALKDLEKQLKDVKPFLRRLMADPGLDPLFTSVNDEIQTFIKREIQRALEGGGTAPRTAPPGDAPDIAGMLPILTTIIDDMADTVTGKLAYKSPWAELFSAGQANAEMQEIPKEYYLEFAGGRMFLLLVKPVIDRTSFAPSTRVLEKLRPMLEEMRRRHPEVQIGLTGEPVLENDEMDQSEKDSLKASLLSLVLIVVLFLRAFGSITRPLMSIGVLLVALAWTMGFTTLTIGYLNIMTVTCMPMLIGLGIDFGIQIICRYEEERLGGFEPLEAMENALGGTGASIVTAGFTTAVSFLSAMLTGFKGVGELGLLAGGGILLSTVAMLVVLPAALLLVERRARGRFSEVRPSPLQGLQAFESGVLVHPWGVLVLGVIFSIICLTNAFNLSARTLRVGFDSNLLNLQSRGVESVEWIRRLKSNSERSIIFAVVVAKDLEEARRLDAELKRLPAVKDVESAVPMFPENQAEKMKIIPGIRQALSDLPPLKEPLPPIRIPVLATAISDLRGIFFLVYPEARKAGELEVSRQIRSFVLGADQLLERLEREGARASADRLYKYQHEFFHDLADKLDLVRGPGPVTPMTFEALPHLLRQEMVGRSGRLLLRVFPRGDVWEQAPREEFLEQVERVAPHATGTPKMMHESTRLLRKSYEQAGKYAFVVIVVLVFLHFLSIRATLLALSPLIVGLLWMLGVMALLRVPFNPANYLVLPLILGIGVANGIYVVRRFQEEGSPAIFSVSTGRAILLSNLTSIIGFASLMIAKYTGIMTLGLVMSLGIGSCCVTSLILLPAMLQILSRFRIKV